MSFIKLNSSKINYINTDDTRVSDFILSDIIDSNISPEYPQLIQSVDQLKLYFGDTWDLFNYYSNLINSGITLYLYKPLSSINNTYSSDYINYSDWDIVEIIDFLHLPGEELNSSEKPKNYTRYKIDSTYYIYNTNEWDSNNYGENGTWISESQLPENFKIPENSNSWINRDTISFLLPRQAVSDIDPTDIRKWPDIAGGIYGSFKNQFSNNYYDFDYSNIEFSYDFISRGGRSFSRLAVLYYISSIDNLYLSDLSFAITLDFSQVENFNNKFFIIQIARDYLNSINIFFNINPDENDSTNLDIYNKIDGIDFRKRYYEIYGDDNESIINNIIDCLTEQQYNDENIPSGGGFICTSNENNKIEIYSDKLVRLHKISNIDEFQIINNLEKSKDIIDWASSSWLKDERDISIYDYKYEIDVYTGEKIIMDNYYRIMDFYSKFIGYDDNKISITILKSDKENNYIIEIQKLDYIETYESTIYGINSLETLINQGSKLVHCKTHQYYLHTYIDNSDTLLEASLPYGTWELNGGVIEDIDNLSRWTSLNILKNQTILEDFLLINNILNWLIKDSSDYNYYLEYIDLLDYAETHNCLVLIQNNNDYLYNYINDIDNRLIYFYSNIIIDSENSIPGYHYFLSGILFNQWDISNLYFIELFNSEPVFDITTLDIELEKYKCNYISSYNNIYAYKKYFWGSDYNMSGTLCYLTSKLSRLFERYKWSIIEGKTQGDRYDRTQSILRKLLLLSNLVYSIDISNYYEYIENQSLTILVTLKSREFLEKDIKINIIINYN